MDKFPDEINRKSCMDILKKNEEKLLCETREIFRDGINDALKSCCKYVILNFDERLWGEHRITITSELLERFQELKISTAQEKFTITKVINSPDEIPEPIKSIRIDF